MPKINCWEFNHCGRELGGNSVDKYGKCHSVMYKSFNGINSGLFGGRYCWHIAGTYHDGDPTCLVITKPNAKITKDTVTGKILYRKDCSRMDAAI